MANRFNVKVPRTEEAQVSDAAALHVQELAEKDYEAEVVGAALPVVLDFYGADSKACADARPQARRGRRRSSPARSAS